MMNIKKCVAALLCVLLLLTGCSDDGESVPVNENFGGEISLFAYTPDSLNPLLTKYTKNATALSVMYDSVMRLTQSLETELDLAESYRFSEDGKSCTFRLKQDVKFSDGSPLTAKNVVASMDMIKQNPEGLYYRLFEFVDSYFAGGEYAFTVNLKKGGASFLSYMNFPVVKSTEELLGSGEYKLVQKSDEKLILSAADEMKTNIQSINIVFYPSEEMYVNSFLTNETDVVSADFYTLAQLTSKSDTNVTGYISDYYTFLGFNNEKEIFGNTDFKKAVAATIDKDAMTQSILVGHAVKTNSPYRPETIYHGLFAGEYAYDTALAAQYLENCEFEEVPAFNILVNNESPAKIKTAEYISQSLKEIGVTASVLQVEYDTYLSLIQSGDYDAFIGEYTMAADFELDFMLGEGNALRYYNEMLINQMNVYSAATDTDARKAAAEQIQRILAEDLPVISLYYRTNMVVADNRVEGVDSPPAYNIYNNITSWVIK